MAITVPTSFSHRLWLPTFVGMTVGPLWCDAAAVGVVDPDAFADGH